MIVLFCASSTTIFKKIFRKAEYYFLFFVETRTPKSIIPLQGGGRRWDVRPPTVYVWNNLNEDILLSMLLLISYNYHLDFGHKQIE
jgi:hypothetical protein